MNWILVILQATAYAPSPGHIGERYGWTTIGEFATEQQCVAASAQLAQASQNVRGVRNFQCLKKG